MGSCCGELAKKPEDRTYLSIVLTTPSVLSTPLVVVVQAVVPEFGSTDVEVSVEIHGGINIVELDSSTSVVETMNVLVDRMIVLGIMDDVDVEATRENE